VKPGPDANVHVAEARDVGDGIREQEMRVKDNTKITDKGIRVEGKGCSLSGWVY